MSLFPPRCFSCGKVIVWEKYDDLVKAGKSSDDALDQLKMRRMCCRRMFLGYVPELEECIAMYPPLTQSAKNTNS